MKKTLAEKIAILKKNGWDVQKSITVQETVYIFTRDEKQMTLIGETFYF
jgi:hypothetical protein